MGIRDTDINYQEGIQPLAWEVLKLLIAKNQNAAEVEWGHFPLVLLLLASATQSQIQGKAKFHLSQRNGPNIRIGTCHVQDSFGGQTVNPSWIYLGFCLWINYEGLVVVYK